METGEEPLEVDDGRNSGDGPLQQGFDEPTPPSREDVLHIPPLGSGARLGFLLGVQVQPLRSSGAQGAGQHAHIPPMAETGNRSRKRAPPTPVAGAGIGSSSGGGGRVQKKGKQAVGGVCDKQAKKTKSPCPTPTSCSSKAPSESGNEVSNEEEDEVVEVNAAATLKLTSDVWLEMTKKKVRGEWKGICNYCNKQLTAGPKSGTSHLRDHLKICTLRMLKLKNKAGKSLSQSSLRMTAEDDVKDLGGLFMDCSHSLSCIQGILSGRI